MTTFQAKTDGGSERVYRGSEPAHRGSERTNPAAEAPEDTEALGDEIARLDAHIHAATYRLLVLIRAFDEREGWGWGFRSCANWLSWRTGIAPGAAREKVRVARALGDLPLISGAMARGQLSFSKVRALTRVATPGNEKELLELARHATAAHLERIVRGWKLVDRLEDREAAAAAEAQRHANRFLRLFPDHDGSWVIRGRLDPEVGALLEKALEWAREALYRRAPAAGPEDMGTEAPRRPSTRARPPRTSTRTRPRRKPMPRRPWSSAGPTPWGSLRSEPSLLKRRMPRQVRWSPSAAPSGFRSWCT
jgi:hypothetical protein